MSFGFPHSSNSPVVSGILSSNIVDITSTNGTAEITPFQRSGLMFITAPINNPPALPPAA